MPDLIAVYSNADNGGATLDVLNVEASDQLVALVGNGYSTAALGVADDADNAPWTPVGARLGSPEAPDYENFNLAGWSKVCTAAGTHTLSVTAPNENALVVLHVRDGGAIDGTPTDVVVSQGAPPGTTQTVGAVSPTGTDDLLVAVFGGIQFGAAITYTAPAGMAIPTNGQVSDPSGHVTLAVAVQTLTAAGSTGARSATADRAPAFGAASKLFAIRTTTAGGGDGGTGGGGTGGGGSNTPMAALPTFVDGVLVHAAQLTTIADDVDTLAVLTTGKHAASAPTGRPLARLLASPMTSNQNELKTITWSGVDAGFDPDGMWSSGSPDHITIATAGWYDVVVQCAWGNIGAGSMSAYIALDTPTNIVAVKDEPARIGNPIRVQVVLSDFLPAGTKVYGLISQSAADGAATAPYWGGTWMSAVWDSAGATVGASGGTSGSGNAAGGGNTGTGSGTGGTGGGSTGGSADDGVQAAVTQGWGSPIGGDEFGYSGDPDPAKWDVYNTFGQTNGTGVRYPEQCSVANGMLTITGSADNHGGAVSYKHDNNTRYHRWEARMRHYRTGGGGADDYHPVLLMWPDSENWPDDGEQDFSESNVGDSTFSIYIHYGGGQDAQEGNAVDLTQFNNYAVEWIPGHVRVYLNGTLIFDDTNGYVQTASPMHPTAQLDSGSGPGAPMNPCRMDVAWYRQYAV